MRLRLKKLNQLSEKWEDFSDEYFIGDDGCIYHLRKLKSGFYRDRKYGYQQVRGYYGTKKQHTVRTAIATAKAFVENPEGLSDVDHINNDKADNRAENLQWLSHRDNILKMHKQKKEGDVRI